MQLTPDAVALVTGAASGLGEATARRLAAQGVGVVLVDLPTSHGADVATDLGERAVFVGADVRDEDQVQAAVDAAVDFGTLRVAVACAGIVSAARLVGRKGVHPLQLFRDVIDINLVGTFNTLRLAAAAMVDNDPVDEDRGVVVMASSTAAWEGQVGQAAYASSKGAIAALTLTAARDLADKAIRVVGVAPGTMETPMMAGMPEATKASLGAAVPHPSRLGRPDEYASLVSHIIDNGLLNGEVIRLDGAQRMPPR